MPCERPHDYDEPRLSVQAPQFSCLFGATMRLYERITRPGGFRKVNRQKHRHLQLGIKYLESVFAL